MSVNDTHTVDSVKSQIRDARLECKLIQEELKLKRMKQVRKLKESEDQWDYL